MPAQGVLFTMFMGDEGSTISESHVFANGSGGITDSAVAAATALFKARMALAGFGVTAIEGRLSQLQVFRDSKLIPLTSLAGISPVQGTVIDYQGKTQPNDTDQPNACILLRAESGVSRRKPIYLGGVLDVLIRENPALPVLIAVPAWATLFNAYRALLVSGLWGFAARIDPATMGFAPVKAVNIVTQAGTGFIGVVVPSGAPPTNSGLKAQTRLFTMTNRAFEPLNGTWDVASIVPDSPSTGLTTWYLYNSNGVSVANVRKFGTLQLVDTQTWVYTDVIIERNATRKRGNRSLVSPGRRQTLSRI
jgi:hypothetical protein